MNPDRNRFWLVVRLVLYGALALLAVAIFLPSFVESRWASSGMPVLFKVSVTDAQTGQPVAGAKVLIWFLWEESWISGDTEGDNGATTNARGTCEVRSHLPGSGSGRKGRLRPNLKIWVNAEGYESTQSPVSALLGESVAVTNAFQTNSFPLTLKLTRREAR